MDLINSLKKKIISTFHMKLEIMAIHNRKILTSNLFNLTCKQFVDLLNLDDATNKGDRNVRGFRHLFLLPNGIETSFVQEYEKLGTSRGPLSECGHLGLARGRMGEDFLIVSNMAIKVEIRQQNQKCHVSVFSNTIVIQ